MSEEGGNWSIGKAVEVVEEVVSVEDEGSVEAAEEEEKEGRVVVDNLEVVQKRRVFDITRILPKLSSHLLYS